MFQTLRNKLVAWLASKAITAAFVHLEAEHLGQRLGRVMDAKILPSKLSRETQLALAKWLETVAKELRL